VRLTCRTQVEALSCYYVSVEGHHGLGASVSGHTDLAQSEFDVAAPHRMWASDFTYIWTAECWGYLTMVLAGHDLTASTSRRGNCWGNAMAQCFLHTLTKEQTRHLPYRTREETRQDIFDSIEVFDNRAGRHSTLGSYAPRRFRSGGTSSLPALMK